MSPCTICAVVAAGRRRSLAARSISTPKASSRARRRRSRSPAFPRSQLETFDGAIEIHSWDRNEVEVEIEKRAMEQGLVDEMKVVAEQQGNKIVVKVTGPPRRETRRHPDRRALQSDRPPARRVAAQSQITAKSGDGSITIEDVNGKITLTTNDGSVRASRLSGEIIVRSGDGSIRMDRVEGKLDLETEDGSITGEAKPTTLRAQTSDGSIRLRDRARQRRWRKTGTCRPSDGTVVLTLAERFQRASSTPKRATAPCAPLTLGEERNARRRGSRRTAAHAESDAGFRREDAQGPHRRRLDSHRVRLRTGRRRCVYKSSRCGRLQAVCQHSAAVLLAACVDRVTIRHGDLHRGGVLDSANYVITAKRWARADLFGPNPLEIESPSSSAGVARSATVKA